MATENFQPGEGVRHKSGGPFMIVLRATGNEVVCEWSDDNNTFQTRVFNPAVLRKDDGLPSV